MSQLDRFKWLPLSLVALCGFAPACSKQPVAGSDPADSPPPALAANTPVEIDPLAKRAEIRKELLKYAPLGSSSREVIAFLKTRLLKADDPEPVLLEHAAAGPSAKASANRGAKIIKLNLGDYIPNTILLTLSPPMPFQEAIIAQWAFDGNDKLVDLFLDRKLEP